MAERLSDFQAAFAEAISTGGAAPGCIAALPGTPPVAKRFDVYRNNVHASLIDALEAAFPAVERLVGRDFFRAAARLHLESGMPERGTLIGFGSGFPHFLDSFPPLRSFPYLGDVARLELLWLQAYHAADAAPLDPAVFARMGRDEIAVLRPVLHPSLRLFSSRYPVAEIWRTNREDDEVKPVDMHGGGDALIILRPETHVLIYKLPPQQIAFLRALREGANFGEAALALPPASIAGLPALLQELARKGVFAAAASQ
ncbi:MAG: DUF2063 domain-containing protein [Alphaproteobacteria bacterium HGW-Alphaproteobacteria-3]|nr:MAG: DUF2063 domain-containing protein [Alphaproteobacteria bacterium HGW-Alphaproteobacteria-3]